MYATKVIVEVVRETGRAQTHTRELGVPQTLCDVQDDLWRKVGRRPAVCLLSKGTARVIFQEGRRASDTLDSLENLVKLALEGGEQ